MPDKYNEIIQLVHPLFDIFLSHNYQSQFKTEEEFFKYLSSNKEELIKLNTLVKSYKKVISIIKTQKPNALFVIINPLDSEILDGDIQSKAHKKAVNELMSYAKQELKDRFEYTSFDPGLGNNNLFKKEEIYERLNRNLKVYSFGEYADACASTWLEHTCENLQERRFNIIDARIIRNRSITLSPNSIKTHLDKKIKLKQERFKVKQNTRKIR
jgi:hypothetical protein